MNGALVSQSPSLLTTVRRSQVLTAPLEGASRPLAFQQAHGGGASQLSHQRSSLPMPAPSPPPQTIDNGNSIGRSYGAAGSSRDAAPIGYRKSPESAPLVGIGPEAPTFISSPTGLLPISTGLSPTKGSRGGSLASAGASDPPGPAGYYPPSSYSQPPSLAPVHAAPSSVGSIAPQGNIYGVYPNLQPLYMTRPAATAAGVAEFGKPPFSSAPSAAAGLPQGHLKTEDNQQGGGGFGEPIAKGASSEGGASMASLDSSSFFAITPPSPLLSTTSDLADLTHPELEKILLRQSPETTLDGGLVDGSGFVDFPVIGGSYGGMVGGCSESTDESCSDSGGGRGRGGGAAGGGPGVHAGENRRNGVVVFSGDERSTGVLTRSSFSVQVRAGVYTT